MQATVGYAAGPLIKPAKLALKWPWAKKEKAIEADPFAEYGAEEQRRLAAELTGTANKSPKYQSPRIRATNNYAAAPGSAAAYPWPTPVDSTSQRYQPASTPPQSLYPNSRLPLDAAAPAYSTPLTPPVSPANTNGGALYSHSRVPGTSVTAPTINPASRGPSQSNVSSYPSPSANNGALYPSSPYVSSANPPASLSSSTVDSGRIVPNYARPARTADLASPPTQMRVTTITPNANAPLSNTPVGATQNDTQHVSATGRPLASPPMDLPIRPPSARLSESAGLPRREVAPLEAELMVPRKPISPPRVASPTPNVTTEEPVQRVAITTAGVPAVANAQAAKALAPIGADGPFFDPEKRPNYDDQYFWQGGARQSSRRKWNGPPDSGTNQTASALEPVTDSNPNPSVSLPAPPQSRPPSPANEGAFPSGGFPLPLPPISPIADGVTNATAQVIHDAHAAADELIKNASDDVSSLKSQVEQAVGDRPLISPTSVPVTQPPPTPLPLPPLVKASSSPSTSALASARNQVAQVAHQAVENATNQVENIASAVLNAPVASPYPTVPAGSAASPIPTVTPTSAAATPVSVNVAGPIEAALNNAAKVVTPLAPPIKTAAERNANSQPIDMASEWRPDSTPLPVGVATPPPPHGGQPSNTASVPTTTIPRPPQPKANNPLSRVGPIATGIPSPPSNSIGQASHVSPATPSVDMNSAFRTNDTVAPATTLPTATFARTARIPNTAPPINGTFHPGEMDQSIWGDPARPTPPMATSQPTPPRTNGSPSIPTGTSGNRQASATQDFAPTAFPEIPPPSSDAPSVPAGLGDLDQASQIIAIVGDQSILAGDLLWQINDMLAPYIGEAPKEALDKQRALLMEKMLPRLVENKLVYLDFLRTIPREKLPEIQTQVLKEFTKTKLPDLMKKGEVGTAAELDAKLRKVGSSLAMQQQMFLEQLVGRQMVQQNVNARTEVTHDELLEYYYAHAADYDLTGRARWEQIMVRWDQFPSRDEARKALSVMGNEVLRGEKLGEVAKRGSQCPRAADGGSYDWTQKSSLKSKTIDDLLFSLPVGSLSRVVEDEDGAHILRVVERREAGRVGFDEVQSKINDAIQAERFKAQVEEYLTKLKQETKTWTAFDK